MKTKTASIAYGYTQNPGDQRKHLVPSVQPTDLFHTSEGRHYTNAENALILHYRACLDVYCITNNT